MIECTKIIRFDSAHRVIGHQNKCQYLHGHRYILEITAQSEQLDDLGMVVDFGELKTPIKNWIDSNLDHNVILSRKDHILGALIEKETKQHVYYLDNNPTAENIALHIKYDIIPLLFINRLFQISKLKLFETPNAYVVV